MNEWLPTISLVCWGTLVSLRLILAPYWMHSEVAAEYDTLRAAADTSAQDRELVEGVRRVIARGYTAWSHLRQEPGWDYRQSYDWYNAWRFALHEVLNKQGIDEQFLVIDARVDLSHLPPFNDPVNGIDVARRSLEDTWRVQLERASALLGRMRGMA